MSEIIVPPEYYFTGVNFNPAFYNQNAGTGITQEQANLLYLRKTVADTATAVETFSAGINSNTLDATAVGSAQTIGSSLTTGSLTLAGGLTTGDITIGNSTQTDTTITQNATKIISNMKVGTEIIKIVNGNPTDFSTSMTTTFNRKTSTSASTIDCYKLTANSDYVSQYFELIVSGSNNSLGGFAYKMSFVAENDQLVASAVNQTILSSYHNVDAYAISVPVNVTFSVTSILEIIIRIQTPTKPSDIKQNFVSTLIGYPAARLDNTGGNQLINWKIEAL